MKHRIEVLLLATLFVLFGIAISSAWGGRLVVSSDSLLQGIGTMASTFFGAWLAFRLQSSKEDEKERNVRIEALREAQFTLIARANKLQSISNQILLPHKDRKDRWLTLPAVQHIGYENMRTNYGRLYFLLEPFPNQLLELQIAEDSFFNALQAINNRSAIHQGELQPAIESISRVANAPKSVEDLEPFLGARLVTVMERATEDCFVAFEDALKQSAAALEGLRSSSKVLFPKTKFLGMSENG